jgi:hypothetical protein
MMLDAGFLANSPQGNLQTFIGNGDWQIWNKPRGYTMCQILAIGAGGGGGSPAPAGGLGSGGGSGATARLTINLMFLPAMEQAAVAPVLMFPTSPIQQQLTAIWPQAISLRQGDIIADL